MNEQYKSVYHKSRHIYLTSSWNYGRDKLQIMAYNDSADE